MSKANTPTAPAVLELWRRLRRHDSGLADPSGPSNLRRVRRGVIALAILVTVLAIVLVVQASIRDRGERFEAARGQTAGLARAVDQYVARLLDSNGQYLFDLRSMIEAEGGLEAIARARLDFLLRTQRLHDQATRRSFLVDAEGIKRVVVSDVPEEAISVAKRAYFLTHLRERDRGVTVTAPFRAEADNEWVMPISVRLDRPDGGFGGVAVLSFDVRYLLRYFQSLDAGADASIALATPEGRILVRVPEFEQTVGAHIDARTTPFTAAEGFLEADSPIDGSRRLVAYRKVADYPLYAVVTIPRERIASAWMHQSLLRAATGGTVIGILVLFTVLLLVHLESERLAFLSLVHFQRAVDHSGDLLYWITEHGQVVHLNQAAIRRFAGPEGKAPANLTIHELAAHPRPDTWRRFWAELKEKRAARYPVEHRDEHDHRYPVEVTATYIEIDGTGYAFLIARDVAQR